MEPQGLQWIMGSLLWLTAHGFSDLMPCIPITLLTSPERGEWLLVDAR